MALDGVPAENGRKHEDEEDDRSKEGQVNAEIVPELARGEHLLPALVHCSHCGNRWSGSKYRHACFHHY